MMVVAAVVLMGTAITTKAVSLLRVSDVSMSQHNDNGLVLKHASELFGSEQYAINQHGSHGSHTSHSSHVSHASHYSSG